MFLHRSEIWYATVFIMFIVTCIAFCAIGPHSRTVPRTPYTAREIVTTAHFNIYQVQTPQQTYLIAVNEKGLIELK